MKLSTASHTSIVSAIQQALQKYASAESKNIITDIHLQPSMATGELAIYNDDEELLAKVAIQEWADATPEDFYAGCELVLKKNLNQMYSEGAFASLAIVKPYSFVMVDHEKETLAELLIVDEDETLFLSGELLKGLDDELNAFLKDLLED
jgi:hypothetical protein